MEQVALRVHLSALGCRLNEAELESWAAEFSHQGHQIVQSPDEADTLVLNTCAVTKEAVAKSRRSIQRLQRESPKAKLVVSGCYISLTNKQEHESLGIDLVVNNSNKSALVRTVETAFSDHSMPVSAGASTSSALFQRNRQRAFVKIQDGCRYRCTFCIVTIARGDERSRSAKEIIDEINRLHSQGVNEVVLTGVHVGGYGSDLDSNLHTLVATILKQTSIPRIRFASVEPWDLPTTFFDLFENPRLLRHMHLPLQSGADSVLRRMARRCKTDDFKRLVETTRARYDDFNITTDIIVGFPGETEDEWNQTVKFAEELEFGHIHIFNYSVREGTKAARLPDHIESLVKKRRSRQLHEIAAVSKRNTLKRYTGESTAVLWEKASKQGDLYVYQGYTPNYLRVKLVSDNSALENTLCTTELANLNNEGNMLLAGRNRVLAQPPAIKAEVLFSDTPAPDLAILGAKPPVRQVIPVFPIKS